jgi:hypothetical protein
MLTNPKQYQESHPSIYIPKHAYKKYKMQHNQNYRQTGVVNQIKARHLKTEKFAIVNLIKNHNYSLPRVRVADSPLPPIGKGLNQSSYAFDKPSSLPEPELGAVELSNKPSIDADETKMHFFVAQAKELDSH